MLQRTQLDGGPSAQRHHPGGERKGLSSPPSCGLMLRTYWSLQVFQGCSNLLYSGSSTGPDETLGLELLRTARQRAESSLIRIIVETKVCLICYP